jgi:hypothetical protein
MSSLELSDVDPSTEETCSTSASSVTPELERTGLKKAAAARTYVRRKKRSLIIFDWDDTILPTSFLAKNGLKLDSPAPTGEVKDKLDKYSKLINRTLTEASRRGHVMVVTNAETGWIQLTVEKFLPLSAATVLKVQHISARSMFEPTGVLTPLGWKHSAFRLVVEEYTKALGKDCQVISLGDSAHEREAALKVCGEFNVICKSLKFMERPDLDALSKQHQLIQDCLEDIVNKKESLDLCIQASSA